MIPDRRLFVALLAGAVAAPWRAAFGQSGPAKSEPSKSESSKSELPMTKLTAYAFSFAGLNGGQIRLSDYAGKPILVVNTASQCGYTPQFTGLQDLWKRFHERGLMIIGVPSNDFGGQEPGDTAEIDKTAHGEYGVGFPLAAKTQVKGDSGQHPFFKWAASEKPLELPRWNFHKYLVGRDGHIAKVFPTQIEPTDARVLAAIAKELG